MRLFQNADYVFIGNRRRAYVISAALFALTLLSLILRGGLAYGVEFTGGTLIQIRFADPITVGEVRDAIGGAGREQAEIQQFGRTNEFLIRLSFDQGSLAEGAEAAAAQVEATLTEVVGADGFEVVRTEAVGPEVGQELRMKALWAILLSFLCVLIYLAFRFEWRFGVAAIIAVSHDIAITLGFISVFGIEVTLGVVAALLTIVGYSMNDTIIVFDRVRENLHQRRKEGYPDLLDRSINETLPRTVITGSTTLLTLVALSVFGGAVIRPFAVILIVGIVVGTFSSIFVASPILLEIEMWIRRRERRKRELKSATSAG